MQYNTAVIAKEAPLKIRNSWCKDGTKDLNFILFLRIPVCIIFQQSPLHAYVESEMNGTEPKKKKSK